MLGRMLLVVVLALVVGFCVEKVFEQDSNTRIVAEPGEQLDAAIGANSAVERWYDYPTTIGLMAGGVVFLVGVVTVASMRPKAQT
ncbi:MAG: hypothetical protein QM692_15070 [Thermomicrobiales bacterium]